MSTDQTDWRTEASKRGELEFDEGNYTTRVVSHPTRAAMLVGRLREEDLAEVTWERAIVIKGQDWVLSVLGERNNQYIVLVVTLKNTRGIIDDPQEPGLNAILEHLHLTMRDVQVET